MNVRRGGTGRTGPRPGLKSRAEEKEREEDQWRNS